MVLGSLNYMLLIRLSLLYLTRAVSLGSDTYGKGISSEVTTWLDNMPNSWRWKLSTRTLTNWEKNLLHFSVWAISYLDLNCIYF